MEELTANKKFVFVLLLFMIGWLVLGNVAGGLKAVQELAVRIVKVWQEFISMDVVGII
jgi:hypothetical protein